MGMVGDQEGCAWDHLPGLSGTAALHSSTACSGPCLRPHPWARAGVSVDAPAGAGCCVPGAAGGAWGAPRPAAWCWGQGLAPRGCQEWAIRVPVREEQQTEGGNGLCVLMPWLVPALGLTGRRRPLSAHQHLLCPCDGLWPWGECPELCSPLWVGNCMGPAQRGLLCLPGLGRGQGRWAELGRGGWAGKGQGEGNTSESSAVWVCRVGAHSRVVLVQTQGSW